MEVFLLLENYSKGQLPQLQDKSFSIYDFVVFNFDGKGNLTNSYRIPKKEQNIELSGAIASQKGVSLSLLMRRYNMFSYLKTVQMDGKPYILFTNTVNNQQLIYRAALEKPETDKFPEAPAEYIFPKDEQALTKFEMMSNKILDFGAKLDKTLTGTDQKFTTFRDPSFGHAVSDPNNVLVYFYDKEIKTLYIRVIKY